MFYGRHHDLVDRYEISVSHHSWLITGFVTRLIRRVPLVEQKLLTLPEFTPSFSGVRVIRSLVLCVCFVDRCLSFSPFSFGHFVACSSIYGFWLPLWYLHDIVLSVILRFTDSDYLFGIFKLFLCLVQHIFCATFY